MTHSARFITGALLFLVALGASSLLAPVAVAQDLRLEVILVDSPVAGLKLALHHEFLRARTRPGARRTVLFAEGSAVPTAGNAALRIEGLSWMDELAHSGFDVWSLDYLGMGSSSRYPPSLDVPVGRAADCAAQLEAAARYILRRRKGGRLSLIGDSFGSLPAGILAARSAAFVDRLVLFAAVSPAGQATATDSNTSSGADPTPPRYQLVTVQDIWDVYSSWLPTGESAGLDRAFFFDVFGPQYLASDPESKARTPQSVRVPNGTSFDDLDIAQGHFPYDPAAIRAPTLVINGEWDPITTEAGGRRLFDALTGTKIKRRVIIGYGTHLVQLEPARFELYREVKTFLESDDTLPSL